MTMSDSVPTLLGETERFMRSYLGSAVTSGTALPENEPPELVNFFNSFGRSAPAILAHAASEDLTTLHRIGVACRLCHRFELAELCYQRALELAEPLLGADSLETAMHRNFLAGLYFVWGRYADSVTLLERSLQVYNKVLGEGHDYTRLTYFGLALAYHGLGDNARSKQAYAKSELQLPISFEAKTRDRWSEFSMKLSSLAAKKFERGSFAEAVELFRHCVIHEANEAWPGSIAVARALVSLGVICRSQGLDREAQEAFEMALPMQKALLGEEHPDYLLTMRQYNDVLGKRKSQP